MDLLVDRVAGNELIDVSSYDFSVALTLKAPKLDACFYYE